MDFDVILLCAGSAERMNLNLNKVLYPLYGKPIYKHSLDLFLSFTNVKNVFLVVKSTEIASYQDGLDPRVSLIIGGKTRTQSVESALSHVKSPYVMIHDGARPYVKKSEMKALMSEVLKYGNAILSSKSINTLREVKADGKTKTLNRDAIYEIYTPQVFQTDLIQNAYQKAKQNQFEGTDDASLYEKYVSSKLHLVEGSRRNVKITKKEDLDVTYRMGHSFDIHPLVLGKPLKLGGVLIPFEKGLKGHSDADVLLHAITESLMGALALGDLGSWFPDTDPLYKDQDSSFFLERVLAQVQAKNYSIENIDCMIYLEQPHLRPYMDSIRAHLSVLLQISLERISIKATTLEKFGKIGSGVAIGSECIVLLKKRNF